MLTALSYCADCALTAYCAPTAQLPRVLESRALSSGRADLCTAATVQPQGHQKAGALGALRGAFWAHSGEPSGSTLGRSGQKANTFTNAVYEYNRI